MRWDRVLHINQSIRALVGLAILGALFYVVGPREVLERWRVYELAWLGVAASALFASTLLGGFNLFLIIKENLTIRFRQFLPGYWLAWAVGLVVPGQVGDVLGLTVWMRRRGYRWETTAGVAIIDKLITLMWMMAFACGGIALVMPNALRSYWPVLPLIAAVGAILTYWVWRRRDLAARFPTIAEFARQFRESMRNARAQISLNFCLTPIKISLIAIAYWSVFRAAGITNLELPTTVLLVAAASLISYVPISFNGIGTVELTGVAIFGAYAIEAPVILSVFVTLRLLVFVLAWLPSAVLLLIPAEPAH